MLNKYDDDPIELIEELINIQSKGNNFKSIKKLNCSDTIVIMGNGPSLKNIDFDLLKDVDTFGLNSAYRFYDEIGFYPTYFGCFDNLVTSNHYDNFQKLLLDKTIPIRKFFFLKKFNDPYKKCTTFTVTNDSIRKSKLISGVAKNLDEFWIYENSGATAAHIGIAMGYKKIILLGVDCSYVEIVDGAVNHNNKDTELVISKTPEKNPNYWRDDYQTEGDVYHLPQAGKFQKPEWERLKLNLDKDKDASDIDIYNCSPISELTCFEKRKINEVLDLNINKLILSVSFLIKSFGRFKNILKLVISIRKYYPHNKIIIFDDSNQLSKDNINEINKFDCILILSEKFDVGLSEGRNKLVDACLTKYMVLLDEDFVFSSHTDISKSLSILCSSSIDIVGGSVYDIGKDASSHNQPRIFNGNLKIENGVLNISNPNDNPNYSIEGYLLYEVVLNFFIAKTESIKKVRWDKNLKLCEHLDFFLRCKEQDLKITYLKEMQVKHIQENSMTNDQYRSYRSRANEFNSLFKEKYGIREIINNGKKING